MIETNHLSIINYWNQVHVSKKVELISRNWHISWMFFMEVCVVCLCSNFCCAHTHKCESAISQRPLTTDIITWELHIRATWIGVRTCSIKFQPTTRRMRKSFQPSLSIYRKTSCYYEINSQTQKYNIWGQKKRQKKSIFCSDISVEW